MHILVGLILLVLLIVFLPGIFEIIGILFAGLLTGLWNIIPVILIVLGIAGLYKLFAFLGPKTSVVGDKSATTEESDGVRNSKRSEEKIMKDLIDHVVSIRARGFGQIKGESAKKYASRMYSSGVGILDALLFANEVDNLSEIKFTATIKTKDATQDVVEIAKEYLLIAAKRGVGRAQVRLGEVYMVGVGVPKNYLEAYAWFSIAVAQRDDKERREKLDIITKKMSSKDRAAAEEVLAKHLKLVESYKNFGLH